MHEAETLSPRRYGTIVTAVSKRVARALTVPRESWPQGYPSAIPMRVTEQVQRLLLARLSEFLQPVHIRNLLGFQERP